VTELVNVHFNIQNKFCTQLYFQCFFLTFNRNRHIATQSIYVFPTVLTTETEIFSLKL